MANADQYGKAILFTLLYFLFSSFVIGYLASIALVPGAPFLRVFQFVFTTALLTYCAAHFPHILVPPQDRHGTARWIDLRSASGLIFALLWPALTS